MADPKSLFMVFEERDALGVAHRFGGPHMPHFTSVHFMQPMNAQATRAVADSADWALHEAQRVVDMLHAAYEAGRQAKSEELCKVIGCVPIQRRL